MKTLRIVFASLIFAGYITSITSCTIVVKDRGNHHGWFKNPKHPHNPNSGKGNGKGNGKGKKK